MTLPSPAAPMDVARALIEQLDLRDRLRHWRGSWWEWKGPHWVVVEDRAVRSRLYKETEHADYLSDDGTKPWTPNRQKIANLIEAMAAVVHLDDQLDQPSWLDGRKQAGPIVATANGLLDVERRELLPHSPQFFNRVSVPFAYEADPTPPERWLGVLGSGLEQLSAASTHGVELKTFIYPGVLCIAVMFTAMFSAASIVWDREFAFLREMMVAPVRRSSIVVGKCLGGATVAASQGLILLALAWAVDIPYSVTLVLGVFALQLLLAFSITAFGVMVAARIKQIQSFMGVMQLVMMPMFFISGALFPVSGLPGWLAVLNRIDPLTYAVAPMRTLVFDHLSLSPAAESTLNPGVTWFGWTVPTALQIFMIFALGMTMMGIAIWEFNDEG